MQTGLSPLLRPDTAMTEPQALQPHHHPYQFGVGLVLLTLAMPLLWWVSHPSRLIDLRPNLFVFWHTVAELVAVVVAMLIFTTGYRAVLSERKGAVVWLGLAFLGVGLLDLLHTMSYVGMPDALTPNTPQKSIFFWLVARTLAAVAMLVYAVLPGVPDVSIWRKRIALGLMLALVAVLAYGGLMHSELLPAFFVAGQGLTPLKIRLEWLIISLNLITLAVLWFRRQTLARECLLALILSVALSAVSELFFTKFGAIDQDSANAIGHAYKVAAYLFLFHATFNEALRRPLEHLQMLHQRENATLNAAPDGVMWVNQQGQIVLANPAIKELSGYSPEELLGQNVSIFLPPHLRDRHAQSMRGYFMAPRSRPMGSMDLKMYCKDGTLRPVDISLGYWEVDGAPHAIAYLRDLTERKNFEESLRHQATHDELTGLPNRWLLQLQLNQALSRAERSAQKVAILFIDLDSFKTINDTFGHAVGDSLLMQVSHRMRNILRGGDTLSRMGGDEFAIVLPELTLADEAVSVALKILASLQSPFDLSSQQIHSGASIGIAYYPDDASDSETLLRFADMAMYEAKEAGRGGYACYSKELNRRMLDDLLLQTRLKTAIAERSLSLHYQPQVDLRNGRLEGAEALLRWQDAVLGRIGPDRFIPVAEATGMILSLSDWVLDTACAQIATWQRGGTPLRLAVNVSAHQLQQGQLADKVRSALTRHGASASLLELEITETVVMTQPQRAKEQLSTLVALGCSVSLDDFGTGYSSLAHLRTLPVSKIKINQSFVLAIAEDPNNDVIVQTIIGMASNLGLDVIAEGVETEEQRDRLALYGCNICQGYLFHRPLPLNEFDDLLAKHFSPARTDFPLEANT